MKRGASNPSKLHLSVSFDHAAGRFILSRRRMSWNIFIGEKLRGSFIAASVGSVSVPTDRDIVGVVLVGRQSNRFDELIESPGQEVANLGHGAEKVVRDRQNMCCSDGPDKECR